ncbi:unnamed protein product [Ectocarpus sp. CCAP 1310/34]|nr:unnamed protein product [Ectocarpus sp. CCAP 1310/34]
MASASAAAGAGAETTSRREYIMSELQQVRELFPAPMIQAANTSFVQVVVMRTPYAKIQARLQFPDDYPARSTSPIVELTSASLPQPFLRKLIKSAEKAARGCTPTAAKREAAGGVETGKAVAALKVVMDAVNKNKFLPCWKELRQAATLVTSLGGGFIADEASGLVTIRVKSGRYTVVALIQVPDGYPMEGCGVELKSHNFPAHIARRHLVQGEEIVRRCLCGYSPELALQTSNPIKIPPGRGGKPAGSGNVRITSEHVRNLKHDVEFIKKAHDLRDVGEGKSKPNAKVAPPSTQERRAARRELKTLAKTEAVSEEEQAKKLAELEIKEQDELLHSQLSDTSQLAKRVVSNGGTGRPFGHDGPHFFIAPTIKCRTTLHYLAWFSTQPSLLPLVDFLVNVFGWRLPQETCVAVFCGHWFHYDCLRVWMTEPPFAKDCPRCGHRVYHPDWPQEPKQLEKAWANRQAKRREVGEVRDFFTVDARFQTGAGQGDDFDAFS